MNCVYIFIYCRYVTVLFLMCSWHLTSIKIPHWFYGPTNTFNLPPTVCKLPSQTKLMHHTKRTLDIFSINNYIQPLSCLYFNLSWILELPRGRSQHAGDSVSGRTQASTSSGVSSRVEDEDRKVCTLIQAILMPPLVYNLTLIFDIVNRAVIIIVISWHRHVTNDEIPSCSATTLHCWS